MICVFTLKGCPYCEMLKTELTNLEYPFEEIDIEEYDHIWEQIVKYTKEDAVPTIFLKKNDDEPAGIYVAGLHFNSIEEGIDIIKKYF